MARLRTYNTRRDRKRSYLLLRQILSDNIIEGLMDALEALGPEAVQRFINKSDEEIDLLVVCAYETILGKPLEFKHKRDTEWYQRLTQSRE